MQEKYKQLIEEIVFEFVKKLYIEEKVWEAPDKEHYDIMDYNWTKWPVEIWDNFLNLDDILLCQFNNFSAQSLIEYTNLYLNAHYEWKKLETNYYSYAKYWIEGKKYSKEELKESEERVKKAEKLFYEMLNKN